MAATLTAGRQLSLVNSVLASGKILLGDSSALAQAVTPSGDVTISNTGVMAIGASKITAAMLGTTLSPQVYSLGVQTAPIAQQLIRAIGTTTGAVSHGGLVVAVTGDSSAITEVAGILTQAGTAAASYTCGLVRMIRVNDAVKGSGSSITTQIGLDVLDQTQGATCYGIRSAVSAGTNKFNFNVTGTAPNAFNGTVLIGTTAVPAGATYNLVLGGGATSPVSGASQADCCSVVAADAVAGDRNLYARNEEGHLDRLTGLACRVSSDFNKTSSTTLSNITGLTRNVEAGATYAFRAVLYTTSNSAGGVKFALGGTCTVTSLIAESLASQAGTIITPGTSRVSALATAVGDATAVTAATVTITGSIVVNAAGTLTVQFAQNSSSGSASTVLTGSFLELVALGA